MPAKSKLDAIAQTAAEFFGWLFCREVSGLAELEGQPVEIIADGEVVEPYPMDAGIPIA